MKNHKKKIKKNRMKKSKNVKTKKTKLNFYRMMQSKIEGYGFNYSFGSFMKQMILFLGGIILLGYLFDLQIMYHSLLIIFTVVMIPLLVVNQFKFIYEQRRFNELVVYLEQMAYSFKKRPKILTALEDTLEVSSGKMRKDVQKAINIIERGYSDNNLYKDAFKDIESDYTCSRLISLHKFLIKIEERGGEYQNSMDILIDDFTSWAKRTYTFQKDRGKIKINIMISIVISLGVCVFITKIIPSKYTFTANPVYQISTLILFIIFISIYGVSQSKLNADWLQNDSMKNEKQIINDYKTVYKITDKKQKKKQIIKLIILSPALILAVITFNVRLMIGIAFLMYFVWIQPKTKIKSARKRTIREITKEVPGWCREIALNLQTENVFMAIASTRNDCPVVLREPLDKLLADIEENPQSVIPYNNFLSEFNISEVSRMMKTLYSLTEYGVDNAEEQINKIIEQNNTMIAKSETLKNEDSIAGIGFITMGPMFIGAIKMMVDMMLMIQVFTQISGA